MKSNVIGKMKMNDTVKQMKLLARAENSVARQTWGHAPKRSGAPRTKELPQRAKKIEAYLQDGMSRTDIAKAMGRSYQAITSYINRYDLGS